MGHVRMMGAIQPFLSGAISKTVNMPEAATAEEIEKVYLEGWKLGLKAIAIYRDGSQAQPAAVSTGKKKDGDDGRSTTEVVEELAAQLAAAQAEASQAPSAPAAGRAGGGHPQVRHRRPRGLHHRRALPGRPARRDLPEDGQGRLDGLRPDGLAGHPVSLALQYGVPLKDLVNKFAHVRFEPSGFTGNQEIPIAKSIVDYIFRWLGSRFLPADEKAQIGLIDRGAVVESAPVSFGAFAGERARVGRSGRRRGVR